MLKSPFRKKSKRRQRQEARARAKWWDRHGEKIRLALIAGGVVTAATAIAQATIH